MHSTSTLSVFDGVTKILGQLLRRFNDHVCPKYNTHDTPSELKKRASRNASEAAKKKTQYPVNLKDAEKVAPTKRNFNLAAYKPHALGHYSSWIRRFGTTDSYSTQTVWFSLHLFNISSYIIKGELEHCRVKRFYARTNRRAFQRQISQHERRTARLQSIKKKMSILNLGM